MILKKHELPCPYSQFVTCKNPDRLKGKKLKPERCLLCIVSSILQNTIDCLRALKDVNIRLKDAAYICDKLIIIQERDKMFTELIKQEFPELYEKAIKTVEDFADEIREIFGKNPADRVLPAIYS